jgi:hypothetical protein
MTWMEKLKLTVKRRRSWPEVQMYLEAAETGAPGSFLAALHNRFPFLPQAYLDMLREYDGLDIAWFVFRGSGHSKYPPVQQLFDRQDPRLDLTKNCPFVSDASGNLLTFERSGAIDILLTDSGATEPQKRLCSDFDFLMDKCFFGPEFTRVFYGREPNLQDDESWVGYLRRAGWL